MEYNRVIYIFNMSVAVNIDCCKSIRWFWKAGNLALAISVTNIFFNLACFNVRPYLISDLENKFSSEQYCSFRIFSCASSVLLCFIYSSFFRYSKEQMLCIMLYMVFKLTEAWVDLYHGFEQRNSRMDIGGISLFARGILSVVSFTVALKLTQSVNWGICNYDNYSIYFHCCI